MYKIIAAVVAVFLIMALFYAVGYKTALNKCNNEWLQVQAAALEKQNALQVEYERALNESKQKMAAVIADFSAANVSLDGLRSAVAKAADLSNTECARLDNNALGQLLIECGERYVEVAKAADLHAADALMCVAAWEGMAKVAK